MKIAPLLLTAGFFFLAGTLGAQSEDEDLDVMPFVLGKNYLHVGLHYAAGPRVAFGQLGSVPSGALLGDATGSMARSYNDGSVGLDTRADISGNPISDGLTNTWNYSFASQVTAGGDVAFHSYSTTSTGAAIRADGAGASGWDISLGRKMLSLGRRAEIGLTAGLSFTDINAKTHGTVSSRMEMVSDVYSLNGQAPPAAPYSAPSFDSQLNDTTVLLPVEPMSRTVSTGTADVDGFWQLKGAYYTFYLGPTLRVPIGERLRISLGAGAAVAFVGTNYRAQESIVLAEVDSPVTATAESAQSTWLPSYYANANAEFLLTPRTGLFLGATYQGKMDYSQTLVGRTATVGFDNNVGVQSGFSVRF